MLKDLNRYNNLGTPGYFHEFFSFLNKSDSLTEQDIKQYFFNKTIDERNVFDGCIPLLEIANIITITDIKEIKVNYDYKNLWRSEQLCKQKLLESFLDTFKNENEFHEIFTKSHFDYLQYKSIVISSSSFTLQLTKIKRLLIDFGFLLPHPDMPQTFLINSRWKQFFDNNITPQVRKLLGIEELKKKLEQQELNGEEAEKFVLEYERRRLNGKEGIEWIAPYDSSAGFDILSFHGTETNIIRFIEVKSYKDGLPYFYWTRNEIKVSEENKHDYYLYLVDRSKMNKHDYKPIMIPNPYDKILNNEEEWNLIVDKYFIKSKA